MRRAACVQTVVALLASATAARAEQFQYTNVQALDGTRFDDTTYGYATSDRRLLTLTLEHFGAWEYGDNYLFTDLLFGRFVDAAGARTGEDARLYAEWVPRLSLSKIAGREQPLLPVIKDVLLTGGLNVGVGGFWAGLAGGGIDFDLPPPLFAGFNAYLRKDAFNRATYHLTPFWELPFDVASLGFMFRGYVDVAGTDSLGTDVNTQPQLLFDVGRLASVRDRVQVGVEWYFHYNRVTRTHSPQAMVRWIW